LHDPYARRQRVALCLIQIPLDLIRDVLELRRI
jgi:hypothetical protein